MEQHKQLILFQRVPAAITLMFWSGTAPPEIFALRYVGPMMCPCIFTAWSSHTMPSNELLM